MILTTHWLTYTGFDVVLTIAIDAVAYLLGGFIIDQIVRRTSIGAQRRGWHKKDIEKRQKTLAALWVNIWRFLVVVVGLYFVIVKLFPTFNFTPLFASAGIIGVALGFGAQSLVRDFLSGVFIVSENQYRVGDIIDITGFSGTVERIGMRSTVLRDNDGNVHYFPNGMITHVINKTMGFSMARFSISVNPSSDTDQVIQIINQTGEAIAQEAKWKNKILEAPKFVSISDFTATSVSIVIAGKTQPSDQWSVTSEMRRRLLAEFETHSIELG